ncbi:MAG: dihydroorotase [Clostridiales bacterium]|nr:dihydroorotase [Clostridiales bacterium]
MKKGGPMKTLIRNGHVLDPATNKDGIYDVLLEDTIIKAVAAKIDEAADVIIEAKGHYVMPGFIDLHVHFREPGFEQKETIRTGSMAAARGGFTSVCPMPNTMPVIDSVEMIDYIKRKEKEDSLVHLIPVGAVTKGQMGLFVNDIKAMAAAGMKAISEDGKSVMDSRVYREAMLLAKEAGVTVLAHCEDKSLVNGGVMNQGEKASQLGLSGISNAVEDIIVARDILLAKETKAKLHLCHCSTKDSVSLVRWAKEQSLSVSAEVCPHHFTLSEEDILSDDANYKMNPPLRSKIDVEALKQGLADGTMDAIATDHAPHTKEEKELSMKEAPFGIVGLETAFALTMTELVHTGYLSPMEMVACLSFRPAKILGIDKGTLLPGRAADLVIADPKREYKIQADSFVSKGKNTPFEGHHVFGTVLMTFVDGKIVYRESMS